MQHFFKGKVSTLLLVLLVVIAVVAMAGCKGSDGAAGAQGPAGINGKDGNNGLNGAATVNFASLANADDMASVKMTGQVTSVTMGANPVVNFTVTDSAGRGVTGLGVAAVSGINAWSNLNYVHVAIAQLSTDATDTTTNAWQNFYVRSDQNNSPANEGLAAGLVDNGDGSYVYTFQNAMNAGVTYDSNANQRVVVQISGSVPGSSPSIPLANPVNIVKDLGAGTQTRDIVSETACNGCHTRIGNTSLNGLGKSSSTPGHGGRITTKYCVMCHTSQNEALASLGVSTVDASENLINPSAGGTKHSTWMISNGTNTYNQLEFVTMIHKTHMGEDLTLQNYSINADHYFPNDITYPQDRRNCTTCHIGPDADNWKNKPSQKACGSCHDNVSWAASVPTGFVAHSGGVKNDSQCALCHDAAAIVSKHIPTAAPDPAATWAGGSNSNTNAAWLYADHSNGNLPVGALAPSYTISSVTTSAVSATQKVVTVKFSMTLGGNLVTFNTDTTSTNGMITGFIGSPSIVVAYAIPQDNATSPVDFNGSATFYLQNIWLGTQGTLSGPVSGVYTAVLTNKNNGSSGYIPLNATMVTAYMSPAYSIGAAGSYAYYATNATYTWGTPPLTQTNVAGYPFTAATGTGGLIVPATVNYKTATGNTARRKIVDNAKCTACHQSLGVEPTFHAGQRNNGEMCNVCHTSNGQSSGWSYNANTFVHAIHGASFRTNKFGWHAASSTDGFWNVTYPAILNNCQACHVAGYYDFSNSSYTSAVMSNMLLDVAVTGTLASSSTSSFAFAPTSFGYALDTNYGTGPAATTVSNGSVMSATSGTLNLVNTPILNACVGCHDKAADIDHMTTTGGGAFYTVRTSAVNNVEQCLLCHGSGTIADISVVHKY